MFVDLLNLALIGRTSARRIFAIGMILLPLSRAGSAVSDVL